MDIVNIECPQWLADNQYRFTLWIWKLISKSILRESFYSSPILPGHSHKKPTHTLIRLLPPKGLTHSNQTTRTKRVPSLIRPNFRYYWIVTLKRGHPHYQTIFHYRRGDLTREYFITASNMPVLSFFP